MNTDPRTAAALNRFNPVVVAALGSRFGGMWLRREGVLLLDTESAFTRQGKSTMPRAAAAMVAESVEVNRATPTSTTVFVASSTLAGLLGFEDRDANSLSLDLQAGDATV